MLLPQLDGAAVLTVDGLAAADGTLASGAAGAHRRGCDAVRLLHAGLRDGDVRLPPRRRRRRGCPHSRGACRQSLPLHRLSLHRGCLPPHRRGTERSFRRRIGQDRARHCAPCLPAPTIGTTDRCISSPRTLDELHRATAEHPDALLHAGGTDLGLRVSKDREAFPLRHLDRRGCRTAKRHGRRRRADASAAP